jgi:hypothetical protein
MNDPGHSIPVGEKPENGSESGGGFFPARFFLSFGPPTVTSSTRGEGERSVNRLTQVKRVAELFLIACLCAVVLVRRNWIEDTLGWMPDDHSGLAESLLVFALVFGYLARCATCRLSDPIYPGAEVQLWP